MSAPRAVAAVTACSVAIALVVVGPGIARAQAPEPYRDPPFTCSVIDYGTDPPELPAPPDDPLCVRYDKTNITVSTLGVVDFLAAEPGRVAIFAAKCSYWQQDHWIVRASPDTPPLVSWEGSYWYDAPSASAAGILRDLRVGDQPADATTFIEALRPLVGDETADQLSVFADDGGGGGASFSLPEGFGGPSCAPTGPPSGTDGDGLPADSSDSAGAAAGGDASGALPETGRPTRLGLACVLLALAGAARVAPRPSR